MNFEESNQRLDEIVRKLENNSLPLEEAFALYEEGINISKDLYKKLNEVKGKVTILENELNNLSILDNEN